MRLFAYGMSPKQGLPSGRERERLLNAERDYSGWECLLAVAGCLFAEAHLLRSGLPYK